MRGASRVMIIDTRQYRPDLAKKSADAKGIRWESHNQVVNEIRDKTKGYGAAVVVETVGFEPDRSLGDRAKAVLNVEKGSDKVLLACLSAVRRGGFVSVRGVYSSPFDNFPIHQFFGKGITMQGGQAPAHKHIDRLLKPVSNGDVRLDDIISHRLPLSQAPHGYDIFRHKKDNCTKVVLKPGT